MEKSSKVKNVQGNGSFDWNDKTFYKFAVDFENGDSGDFNTINQEQNKFIKGEEAAYTIDLKNPQYPKIKPVWKPSAGGNGGGFTPRAADPRKELLIVKQVCIKVAAEMVSKNDPTAVIKTASVLLDWVMNGKAPASNEGYRNTSDNNNLPF
tara:strand:- start:1203 stop:1658 length:456 start_codon:yes stop_codon:yes gene_type:complete